MAKFILTKEGSRFTIRELNGPRYPREKYKNITDRRELEDLVMRLNGKDPAEERTREAVLFKHAYISPALLDDYRALLDTRIPTKKDAGTKFKYLKLSLNYFINDLNIQDPTDWHKKQHVWAKYLQSLKYSAKTLKEIIYELNRFMEYLHQQRPGEVPPLKFIPLSRATLKPHEAKRVKRESLYIPPEHWSKISVLLKDTPIWANAQLAYNYGLRRNETMGLQLGDIYKDSLSLVRQFKGEPLKSRDKRQIPHWFCAPDDCYIWISLLENIHPDTVSQIFSDVCKANELPSYVFHDIRRTFITRCIREGIKPPDLRLAVGHKSLETTSKYYLMDDRQLKNIPFKPAS